MGVCYWDNRHTNACFQWSSDCLCGDSQMGLKGVFCLGFGIARSEVLSVTCSSVLFSCSWQFAVEQCGTCWSNLPYWYIMINTETWNGLCSCTQSIPNGSLLSVHPSVAWFSLDCRSAMGISCHVVRPFWSLFAIVGNMGVEWSFLLDTKHSGYSLLYFHKSIRQLFRGWIAV